MAYQKLAGEVVIVSGAACGPNKEVALALAASGAVVVCVDSDAAGNQKTVDAILAAGGKAFAANAAPNNINAIVKEIADKMGKEPILVNNGQMFTGSADGSLYIRGTKVTRESLAKMIDFSILHPFAQEKDIREGLDICRKYKFNSFCVNPHYIAMVVEGLKGTGVEASVVVDFPFGSGTPQTKLAIVEDVVKKGAQALDPVIDIGALKDKNYKLVTQEIRDIVKAGGGMTTKFIIEVAYLTKEEIAAACKCVEEGGGTYVKSSTGRADRGPSMEEVKLMRDSVSANVGVKVAGTGRFWTSQIAFGCLLAGADLVGTRSGPQIVDDLPLLEEMYGRRLKVL